MSGYFILILSSFDPSLTRAGTVHYLPDWLPVSFKKIGNKGLALQKKMHFWGWELTEKHYVRLIATGIGCVDIRFLTFFIERGYRRT